MALYGDFGLIMVVFNHKILKDYALFHTSGKNLDKLEFPLQLFQIFEDPMVHEIGLVYHLFLFDNSGTMMNSWIMDHRSKICATVYYFLPSFASRPIFGLIITNLYRAQSNHCQ